MTRFDNLQHFITTHFGKQPDTLEAITGDASFRRYFRLTINNQHFIVMDSDPQKVNNAPYLSCLLYTSPSPRDRG